jgi:L-lactate dehydrogenase complex protein LldG
MSAREDILNAIRAGLGRKPFTPAPPALLRIRPAGAQERIASLLRCAGVLAAYTHHACSTDDAREYVTTALNGRTAIASNAPFLRECGIADLPNVQTGIVDRNELRAICATAGCGITSADYALADTGTLVMLSSVEEARMISLLPPAHIAIVPSERILTGLDELLTILPKPAGRTSSMVLITGPSRTGDIEQNLVRGVHGPGEVHLVVV